MHVFCSTALQPVMLECIPDFERRTTLKVTCAFGATADLQTKIERDVPGDVAVLAQEALDNLAALGSIVVGTRVALARSGIVVATRAGQPKPAIDTPEAFRRALLSARSVAHSKTGVSGIYFAQLIERLGIAGQMKGRLISTESRPVGEAVAAGEAELGIQQLSELMPVSGVEIAGPLPGNLQKFYRIRGGSAVARAREAGGLSAPCAHRGHLASAPGPIRPYASPAARGRVAVVDNRGATRATRSPVRGH
jgi:molybdate transport system substrate-binding protein